MDEYISREETLKAFRLTAKNPNKDYQRGMQDTIDCLVPEVIADIPSADVQPVNRWISVKDRLPDDCVEVLAYDTDCGVVIGWYDKEIGDFATDFISPLDAVTHWQPLPEKPQD